MSRGIVRNPPPPAVNPIIRAVVMSRPVRYGLLILLCLAALYRVPADLGQTRGASGTGVNKLMFHGGRERLGWNPLETELTPATVASTAFGPLWNSPALDAV